MGQKLLSDALTDVIIPTFDIKLFKPIIFSSLKVFDSSSLSIQDIPNSRKAKRDKSMDARTADVCVGTSAAPSYFPPYFFKATVDFNLADGGLAANNPVS
ncbi:XYLOSE ISOMERASE [Salix purpurea]|uniref:Patatin n=1 Tax=Salix purpurea TaxID=77065 RepID=A0A9Q0V8Q1_SALPP|nr:XYLOSE ISOMERASE [Salix purpurea]